MKSGIMYHMLPFSHAVSVAPRRIRAYRTPATHTNTWGLGKGKICDFESVEIWECFPRIDQSQHRGAYAFSWAKCDSTSCGMAVIK